MRIYSFKAKCMYFDLLPTPFLKSFYENIPLSVHFLNQLFLLHVLGIVTEI